VILDSQWIGEAVVGEHVVEITDVVDKHIDLADYFAEPFAAYGEYPPNSKRYFGTPFQADAQFLVWFFVVLVLILVCFLCIVLFCNIIIK
jgi:hypothetical protein